MPTRYLSTGLMPNVLSSETSTLLASLRNFLVLRDAPSAEVAQIGTLYQSQLDALMAWMLDLRNNYLFPAIKKIRDARNTVPVTTVDPIDPPSPFYPLDLPPTTGPRRLKTAYYTGRPCKAFSTASGGTSTRHLVPEGMMPLPRPPRPRPWPPWPPFPPPPEPIRVWVPAQEVKYSYACSYYYLWLNLYNSPPFDRDDFRAMTVYQLEYWKYVLDLHTVAAGPDQGKALCIASTDALRSALC